MYSANQDLSSVINLVMEGKYPEEFASSELVVNETDASDWMRPIFEEARKTLAAAVPTAATKSCAPFTMKAHNYELTRQMAAAGWTQWKVKVQAFRTKEECAKDGVKYRQYQYPVHFWVSPQGDTFVWGKIKLQGKYIP